VVSSTADLGEPTRARRYWRVQPFGLTAAGWAIGAVFSIPIGYLVARNFNVRVVGAVRDARAGAPLLRTLALATTTALSTAVIGTALAWCLGRTDLPGRRFLRTIAPLPLVFPSFIGAFCFLAAFTEGGLVEQYVLGPLGVDRLWRIEGFGWSVVVLTLFTYPYVYLPVIARLAALPPSIEESARALGRSPTRTFIDIVLPQTSGAIGAGALLVFLYSLSEFGAVSLLRYDTLTRSIYLAIQSVDERAAFALSLVLALCALVVISGERRWSRRRVRTEAVGAGRSTITYSLGWAKVPALLGIALLFVAALIGPLAVLVQWAVRGVRHGNELHAERLLPALANTTRFGVIGAIVAVVVVMPIAYLSVRHPRALVTRASTAVITSAFAFPGLIVGFAFVYVSHARWVPASLYLSTELLIVAYVVHFGAQALRASEVAVGGVPRRIGDAARALGASPIRRFVSIDLPLMRSGLAAGGGLVLLSIMKELPATLVLRPIEQDTLAIRVWSAADSLLYAQAGFFALVLVAASGVLTWLLAIRPLERAGRL
jgi:iron(III) transport system permease protein